MKRFFLAAALALALHGLLLSVGPTLPGKKSAHKVQKRSVTLHLTTRKSLAPAQKKTAPNPAATTRKTVPNIQKTVIPPKKATPRVVKKITHPVPEKKKPTPRKKVSPPPKKKVKPKKKQVRKKKEIKVAPIPPTPSPEPVNKRAESTPQEPVKRKARSSPLKNGVTSHRNIRPPLNEDNQAPAADLPSPSSAPEVQEIQKTEPGYKNNPTPRYPRKARRRGYEGTVVLKVLVSEEGAVMKIRISESCGHGILDRAAERAVREWTFEPGAVGAKNIEMWVNVPIRFDLKPR